MPQTLIKHLYCSVPKSCPTLCDPMGCSTPGSSVLHCFSQSLLKFMSIELVMLFNHLILCCPLLLSSIFPNPQSGSFPVSELFTSGDQRVGASASVLPMNTQHWFPLGLTGLIYLQSKGLSRRSPQFENFSSSVLSLLYIWLFNPFVYYMYIILNTHQYVNLMLKLYLHWSSLACTRRPNAEELKLSNCGAGEDSWESLGLQGDQTNQS